jgi:hypothetical protein
MAEYDKGFMSDMDLPGMWSHSDFEGGEADNANDIRNVALGKEQRRITMMTEYGDGREPYVRVIIEEPDRDAGMNSTGMRTVREEVVRGK